MPSCCFWQLRRPFRTFFPRLVRSTLPDWATSQTVSLGLDLQGGAHLLLAVDRDDLAEARLQDLRETLAAEMRRPEPRPGRDRTEGLTLSAPATTPADAEMQAAAATAEPGHPADFTVDLSDGTLRLVADRGRVWTVPPAMPPTAASR
jgi:SecD/SecF fusion protein